MPIRLLTEVPVPMAYLDRDLRLISASPAWCATHRRGRAAEAGLPLQDLVDRDLARLTEAARLALSGVASFLAGDSDPAEAAQQPCLHWSVAPRLNRDERVVGVLLMSQPAAARTSAAPSRRRTNRPATGRARAAGLAQARHG